MQTRKKRQAITNGMAMAGIRMSRISFLGFSGGSGDSERTETAASYGRFAKGNKIVVSKTLNMHLEMNRHTVIVMKCKIDIPGTVVCKNS